MRSSTTGTLGSKRTTLPRLPVGPFISPDSKDPRLNSIAAGLNHVRVPIGFWAYDVSGGEPYIQGQAEYLDRVIGWGRNHNVKIMIDLHGAPGSQNGYDNSGRRGQALFATDGNNVNRAKNVIQTLSEKYSDPAYWQVVTSLCLLNEPATYLNDQLLQTTLQYWRDAYGAARYPWAPQGSASKSGLALIISDGFQPLSTFNGFMTEPTYETVMIDTHNYQVFDDTQNAWDWPTHLRVGPPVPSMESADV
jgi:glucan 1,3-beta-glucosidase